MSHPHSLECDVFTRAKSLQMNLCKRFAEASSSRAVNISSLEEKPYSVRGAEWVQTKYGISMILTIKVSSTDVARVFLPRRFYLSFRTLIQIWSMMGDQV